MSKKPSISLSGSISLDPTPKIPGIVQRGAQAPERGPGRPKSRDLSQLRRVSVYLSVDHKKALARIAADEETTMQDLVAAALDDFLRKRAQD